jgi:hypothetical protein
MFIETHKVTTTTTSDEYMFYTNVLMTVWWLWDIAELLAYLYSSMQSQTCIQYSYACINLQVEPIILIIYLCII